MATALAPEPFVRPPLHILASDYDLLFDLALQRGQKHGAVADMLIAELERAEVHEAGTLPPHIVSLGSRVDFIDDGSHRLRSVQLVLPAEADIAEGRISVLTPIGAGLIGLAEGQAIDWPDLDGCIRKLRVISVSQPA